MSATTMQEAPPPHWLDFGDELRNARREAHLTQRELAHRVGVDHTYLSRLEHGRSQPPSTATINALAEALGVDRKVLYRHIWKADTGSMTRSALEELCAEMRRTVDDLRASRMRHGLEEVHISVYDWQRFERAMDRLGTA